MAAARFGKGEQPAEQGGVASVPAADPANPGLILYAGLQDFTCKEPSKCHPLVVDNASGSSYIVSDDDNEQGDYTWSPNGEYVADIEAGTEPGIWVYKNAKETAEAWYVMETPPKTASGGGFTGGLAVTNSGSLIFSSGNDIYSLPNKGCWGASVKPTPGKPTCTLGEAQQLTTSAMDIDPTWTESTQPIVVNPPAPAPGGGGPTPLLTPATPALSGVSQTNATWREGNALATFARKHLPPIGTTFSFSLSEAASVKLEFTQSAAGRKVGRSCVAQTKKNMHKRRCTRTIVAGTLTDSGHAGVNKVRFDGPISRHKKLAPGSYTLLISATAAGKESAVSRLHFTIAKS